MSDIDLLEDYVRDTVLAEKLHCSPRTIRNYENEPDGLPSVRIGKFKMFNLKTAAAWLARRERSKNPRRERSKSSRREPRHGKN